MKRAHSRRALLPAAPTAALVGLASVVLGLTTGCGTDPKPVAGEPVLHSKTLQGVWKTEGYGHVLLISESSARFFEITAISCVPSFELEILDELRSDADAVLSSPEAGLEILVQPGSHDDERWLKIAGLASRRRLARSDSLPESCDALPSGDPMTVLNVFWQTYSEHYPFFASKGIDWQAVRDQALANVDENTTSEELFEVLTSMIEPLQDAHTFLSAPDLATSFGGRRPGRHPVGEIEVARALEIISSRYLSQPPTVSCIEQVIVGRIDGGIRYLNLKSFDNFGSSFPDGMSCLNEGLDLLLAGDGIAGVVIDVRINSGGFDIYGLNIASRFATHRYLAYTKEARMDPSDPEAWTQGQASQVEPTEGAGFGGPVAILIGNRSVSAAETFTMALMRREPEVIRIGENTQGVFSDVMSRSLPNGWSFGLPNERFLTVSGQSFDGPGIPPTIETDVFSRRDLDAGRDSALEKAVEILSARDDSSREEQEEH